ncbi:MAG: alpha-2-macroglobulin [Aquimarina sp.]|nr:alpha-2-macroglobulin [Aquimarina sp.]
MKHLFSLCLILIFNTQLAMAQDTYPSEWKQVETFEQKGLPKSAIEVVEKIYSQASANNNTNQVIKALLYKSKYLLTLEEDAQLKIVNDFKTEIDKSEFPKRNILQNVLANLYWQYFQQNRWKFYNRTSTASKVDQEDFRTWDLETLFKEVHIHYQNSLDNGVLAQQTDIADFKPLLIEAEGSKKLRPSLYDFLAHNALGFYKTSETSINKPSYAFEIDTPDLLSDHKSFILAQLETKDTLSLQFQALKIYQNLIRFHSRAKNDEALSDVNIDRLLFVKENAVFTDIEDKFLTTLKEEKQFLDNKPESALYNYEIANLYKEQGHRYEPKIKDEERWKIKEALELCNQTITAYPKSRGAKKCQVLKEQILYPELSILTENYIPVQESGRILINYKNVDHLYFKVFSIDQSAIKRLEKIYKTHEKVALIKELKEVNSWDTKLPDEQDYQMHDTEIVLPVLAQGSYLILATKDKDFDKGSFFSYGYVQSTNLALVESRTNSQQIFQVLDRKNGKPVPNVKIQLKTDEERGYRNQLNKTITTDEKGQATLTVDNYYYNVMANVSYKDDNAFFNNLYLNSSREQNYQEPQNQNKAFLFTDRSIYRPGQTVYFKGILMSSINNENHKVLANEKAFAKLIDVNGQEVKNLDFITNDYGSFSGEFILPSGGLTGNFTIQTNYYSSTSISVEEYKRPKFEASFNPVTESYRINDSITVKGIAKAYAVTNITDAKVVYRVSRQVRYPIWCWWYPRYGSDPQEIAYGETITNDKGEFTINFKAIPDKSVKEDNQPVFNYEVTADITDINGETRSTTTIVNVGYHTITANIIAASKIDQSAKENSLTISTSNLNGQAVGVEGTLEVSKLISPDQPLRKRPWKAPFYQQLSKEKFKELYPHDAYNNEDDYRSWEKGKVVFTKTISTEGTENTSKGSEKVLLNNIKKWEPGKYIIEFTSKDNYGQKVKAAQYVEVYDSKEKTVSDNQLFEIYTDKSSYASGEQVLLTLGTSAKDMTVTLDIEKDHKIVETKIINLSDECKVIKLPVNKEDIGGFAISYSYVIYNSHNSGSLQITVPYEPTELTIETKTFRDKLQPGSKETWSFTIKGPKGDKVSAELLASMYDMSLDQFKPHNWSFDPLYRPTYYSSFQRRANYSFENTQFRGYNQPASNYAYVYQGYDQLNLFGLQFGNDYGIMKRSRIAYAAASPMEESEMVMNDEAELQEVVVEDADMFASSSSDDNEKAEEESDKIKNDQNSEEVQIRTNLQETAFFLPQLTTDNEGNVSFSFTTPEALTKWKLQLLAHTKTLNTGTSTLETVTQKELMVLPNPPRFLRQRDTLVLSTKIASLAEEQLSGSVELQLINPLDNATVNNQLGNTNAKQQFTVDPEGNTNISWKLSIPDNISAVQYTIIAKAENYSDGEQNVLPVLTNRMLVTETLPMWVRSEQTKTFTLDKLKNNSSNTLKHHKLSLEVTSNPAWYAVQALPYLMEYPYECSEQTFSRFYANTLASHIANSNPRIQQVFNQWKNTDALLSNLEKNEELKSLIIQETPWLRDAQNETEQKKRIALLFDFNKMNSELQAALNKLMQMQYGSGGFPWFKGGQENRYITQHIITGFGHLQKLGVVSTDEDTKQMISKAIVYLDKEFVKEYEELKRNAERTKFDLKKDHLSYTQIHYLYMRSFFDAIKRPKSTDEAYNYYMNQSKKYWLGKGLYAEGMLALLLHRNNETSTASQIIKSLDERSITSEELGMYWKSNTASWLWYQAPVETQALMIEAFSEIQPEPQKTKNVDNLKVWLLKNKQTNSWKTTKATADAVYALLLQGSDWLSVTEMVEVTLGNKTIDPAELEDVKVEAGTGYFKTSWSGNEITSDMATATMTKKGKGIAWGAMYWQYFEDLDKITSAETPLKLKKKLFLKRNSDTGKELTEIKNDTKLEVGDLVTVRIELRSDRAMEFVHMKDMRASGLEPINVLSQYKWQDGLGYYESTRDASTNFFFDYLPKGVYVFEYDLRVNNKGQFSNGITTIQSMYAPEFSSHSEGVRISVN